MTRDLSAQFADAYTTTNTPPAGATPLDRPIGAAPVSRAHNYVSEKQNQCSRWFSSSLAGAAAAFRYE